LISGPRARSVARCLAEPPTDERDPLPARAIRRRHPRAAPISLCVAHLAAGYADIARRRWSDAFHIALRDLLSQHAFDVIHIEGMEMAPYLSIIEEMSPRAVVIYDAHNAEYALQRRIASQDLHLPRRWLLAAYSMVQASRLTALEAGVCSRVDRVIAVSGADAEMLRALPHTTPVTVIPNAIFTSDYGPGGFSEAPVKRPSMVFTGKMDFRPNVDAVLWFAEEILPRIAGAVPGAHFTVVGQKPHPRLDVLRANPDVTLTGWVEDIRSYLRATDVYVAPLRMGSGTRFKLLEAMAMECAIVSTRLGAEGLTVQHGAHLLLVDSPDEFADAVVALLRDQPRRQELAVKAASLVRAAYDWHTIIPHLEAVYADSP
jgi:glycosyltransferase involved in cell wall biosynthesis